MSVKMKWVVGLAIAVIAAGLIHLGFMVGFGAYVHHAQKDKEVVQQTGELQVHSIQRIRGLGGDIVEDNGQLFLFAYKFILDKNGKLDLVSAVKGRDLRNINLSQVWCAQIDFSGANLSRANLEKAIIFCCNLNGAKLTGANLRGADLCSSTFVGADLRGADLRGAKLPMTDFTGAKLKGAKFDPDAFSSQEAPEPVKAEKEEIVGHWSVL